MKATRLFVPTSVPCFVGTHAMVGCHQRVSVDCIPDHSAMRGPDHNVIYSRCLMQRDSLNQFILVTSVQDF